MWERELMRDEHGLAQQRYASTRDISKAIFSILTIGLKRVLTSLSRDVTALALF